MYKRFLEYAENSCDLSTERQEMEDLFDSDLDSLFDKNKEKDYCKVDPAEKESPVDESLLINNKGDIVDYDTLQRPKDFKEDINTTFEGFKSNKVDDSAIAGVNGFKERFMKDKSLQEFLDESYILSEATTYKFNKQLAESNVKRLLEQKNPSMKKKGFLPLTSTNADLKKTVAELKTKGGMSSVKATKISGVVCIQYNFDSRSVCYVGVCYYNKETHKIRVFDVKASVKLNEDLSIINEGFVEDLL